MALKVILAATGLTLLGASAGSAADLIVDTPVVTPVMSSMDQFYIEAYGGLKLPSVSTYYDAHDEYDMEAGWLGGVSFGMHTPIEGLSAEIDLMYTSAEYSYGGDYLNTFSAMANAEYAVSMGDTFALYGFGGLGLVNITFDSGDTYSGTGFGYQVGAGVRAALTEDISAFAEIKHQDTFDYVDIEGDDVSAPTTGLLAGLRFSF